MVQEGIPSCHGAGPRQSSSQESKRPPRKYIRPVGERFEGLLVVFFQAVRHPLTGDLQAVHPHGSGDGLSPVRDSMQWSRSRRIRLQGKFWLQM